MRLLASVALAVAIGCSTGETQTGSNQVAVGSCPTCPGNANKGWDEVAAGATVQKARDNCAAKAATDEPTYGPNLCGNYCGGSCYAADSNLTVAQVSYEWDPVDQEYQATCRATVTCSCSPMYPNCGTACGTEGETCNCMAWAGGSMCDVGARCCNGAWKGNTYCGSPPPMCPES
jgi:hypothetical protein